jgi:hypothetical protein
LGDTPAELSRETALSLCDSFIKEHYPHFIQDFVLPISGGFRLYYRELYREHLVYSNFIDFWVTENGITRVEMQYGEVTDYAGPSLEICSTDEALLTFIQRVRSIWPERPIEITRMDLVYYQEEIRARENAALRASPYYRIFIEDNEVPFMINAYTNTFISY